MSNPKNLGTVGKALTVLTVLYFIIELIINTSVFGQLSSSSDALIIDSMELWGKIVAGLGIALIATRYQLGRRLKKNLINSNRQVYKVFLYTCLVTIPLSFALQEGIIQYVVNKSSDEDRNNAILITATQNTIVPFYTPNNSSDRYKLNPLETFVYPVSRYLTRSGYIYWASKGTEMQMRQPCIDASIEALQVKSDTERLFFQYKTILQGVDEALYKQVIKDHHSCALENDDYVKRITKGNLDQSMLLYDAFDAIYKPAITEYERNEKYGKKAEMDKKWREYMDEKYGFKTTIKPNTDYQNMYYFFKHADTRRYYAEKVGVKDIYPRDEDFVEKARTLINKNLPDQMIPAYISPTGERSEQSKELTDDEIAEQGKKAYKAIVMPIIALGLSGFFLILNIILIINGAVERFIWKARSKRLNNNKKSSDSELTPLDKILRNKYVERLNGLAIFKPFFSRDRILAEYKFMKNHDFNEGVIRVAIRFMSNPITYPLKCLSMKAFLITALTWFILWPSIQTGQEYEAFKDTEFEQVSKWLYYHESNLIPIYNASYEVIGYIVSGGKEDADLWTVLIDVIKK